MTSEWIVIGVSGVTCGGKTTLANQLKEKLVPVYVFHQDKYFYPDDSPKHVKCRNLDHNNYDILSALDMNQMYEDVVRTMRGEARAHELCAERGGGKWEVPGKGFIVIEGFTVLNYKPLLELCNLRYYFVLEYGECVSRRVFRVYDPPDTPGYFEQCVWPEHLRYRAEIERDARVRVLDGAAAAGDALGAVLADVAALGATVSPFI